jgi:YVTN family beta-propeller protein
MRTARKHAILILTLSVSPAAYPSNYSVGGPNQDFFYISNWGKNSHTITRVPSLESMSSLSVGDPGAKPAHIVPDPLGRYVFTINHGGNYVSVIDAATGKLIKRIATGSPQSAHGQGHQYYWSKDGQRLWVTELDDGTLVEIDAKDLAVTRKVWAADYPYGMIPAEEEGYIYVMGEGRAEVDTQATGNKVGMVRISDFKLVKEITVGRAPHEAEYFAGKVYVSNIGEGARSISVIDAAKGEVVKTIDVGFENPHFTEAPAKTGLLVVASKSVPELILIDSKTDEVVARFKADDPNIVAAKTRHPVYHPSGEYVYFPLGYKDGKSRIHQLSVPDLKVLSVSEPSPSIIHVLLWNNGHTRIYASTEGNQKEGAVHGVSVYKTMSNGSLRKLADLYADLPEGEDYSGHHGSLD